MPAVESNVDADVHQEVNLVQLVATVSRLRQAALRDYRAALGNVVTLDYGPGTEAGPPAPEVREAAVAAARRAEQFARSADEAYKALISSDTHLRSAAMSLILQEDAGQAQIHSDRAAEHLKDAARQVEGMRGTAPQPAQYESAVMNRLAGATGSLVGHVDSNLSKIERAVHDGGQRLNDELASLTARLASFASVVAGFPAKVLARAKETGQKIAQSAHDLYGRLTGHAEALRDGLVDRAVQASRDAQSRTQSASAVVATHLTAAARTVDDLVQSAKGAYNRHLDDARAERQGVSQVAAFEEPTFEVERSSVPRG